MNSRVHKNPDLNEQYRQYLINQIQTTCKEEYEQLLNKLKDQKTEQVEFHNNFHIIAEYEIALSKFTGTTKTEVLTKILTEVTSERSEKIPEEHSKVFDELYLKFHKEEYTKIFKKLHSEEKVDYFKLIEHFRIIIDYKIALGKFKNDPKYYNESAMCCQYIINLIDKNIDQNKHSYYKNLKEAAFKQLSQIQELMLKAMGVANDKIEELGSITEDNIDEFSGKKQLEELRKEVKTWLEEFNRYSKDAKIQQGCKNHPRPNH